MYANHKYKTSNNSSSIIAWWSVYFSRKRVVQHGLFLIALILSIAFFYTLYQSSLYTTIPAIVPFLSSIPRYHNAWTFTPAVAMHHPQASMYKAAFMTLIQGDSVDDFGLLLRTVRDLEDSFNHAHGYPFVIFSVDPLSTRAKELVASLTSGTVHFETLHGQQQFYGYGPETQLGKAVKARHQLKDQVDEGDSKTFRFNARFMAGTLYQHPALKELDYIWRFQPGTHYPCPIFEEEQATKDPFYYMYKHQKKLSFSLTVREPIQAAPTLFQTVTDYINKHPEIQSRLTQRDSLWPLVASKEDGQYTQCEFSSSFQIADLSFFRSDQYQSFFDHIDKANGIFYERWSDSAIQSMGAALFLKKQDIHRWEDVGYRGLGGLLYCPTNPDLWSRCDCRPEYNFDDSRTCLAFLA